MKRLVATLCCAAFSVSTVVPAFGADDDRSARADNLFRQGQSLLESGKVDAACAKFEASEAWENGLGTLLHLGDCYERAGRNASAWHTFLEAEAVAHAKRDVERGEIAAERVAALEPKLARVVFVVPPTSRVPGLTVQLGSNTIPASSFGMIIPVDAGTQHLSAFAKGYLPWQLDLEVARTEAREYRVTVPLLQPMPEPVSNRRSTFRTAGVVTGSVGLAGIGAGAVFSALSKNADDANTCARGVIQCTPTKTNSGNGYSEASVVSFAVGGALLATGITLFVLAPSPDNQERHAPLRVAAHVTSNGGRLQLEGAF
jgi:hypothetical protein